MDKIISELTHKKAPIYFRSLSIYDLWQTFYSRTEVISFQLLRSLIYEWQSVEQNGTKYFMELTVCKFRMNQRENARPMRFLAHLVILQDPYIYMVANFIDI